MGTRDSSVTPTLRAKGKQQHPSSSSRRHDGNKGLCKDPFGEECWQPLQGPPRRMGCRWLKASSCLDLCVCFSVSLKCSVLIFLADPPPHPSLSSQGFLAFLAVRRLRDITFQEEYNTLFPNSPSLLP